jgi:hypothetical protein
MSIFDLIKNKEFDKLNELIKNDKIQQLNIKDDTDNYFIHYIINNNQIELFKTCLSKNINLNILDNDNKTVFYIPLKLNYNEIIKLIIYYSKHIIGLSLINYKDTNNLSAINYTIILNQFEYFKLSQNHQFKPTSLLIISKRLDLLETILKLTYLARQPSSCLADALDKTGEK